MCRNGPCLSVYICGVNEIYGHEMVIRCWVSSHIAFLPDKHWHRWIVSLFSVSHHSFSVFHCLLYSLCADIDMKDLTELPWPPPVGQLEEEPVCGEQGELWPLLLTAAPPVSCICRACWIAVLLGNSRLLPVWFHSLPLRSALITVACDECMRSSLGMHRYYNSTDTSVVMLT